MQPKGGASKKRGWLINGRWVGKSSVKKRTGYWSRNPLPDDAFQLSISGFRLRYLSVSVCLYRHFGRGVLFRQGLWIADLQTPPGQECSNGSMLCVAVVL
jgi:hypothetical protein